MSAHRDSYSSWDREAAAQRALAAADSGQASESDGTIWNFAFGSNMSKQKVHDRCLQPVQACRGRLPGWTVLFNHVGGFANIESQEKVAAARMDLSRLPSPIPDACHGLLLRLSRRDFAELARQEYAYDTVEVAVEVYPDDSGSGTMRLIHALAFKTAACALATTDTLPTKRYINILQSGARESGIEEAYCRWLNAIEPATRTLR